MNLVVERREEEKVPKDRNILEEDLATGLPWNRTFALSIISSSDPPLVETMIKVHASFLSFLFY
jgi:hypothetical protein